jgi:hypothetical protein
MDGRLTKDRRVFEIMLIVVVLGMVTLFGHLGPHKMVLLHLFFVPIILSGYFLGRGSAGVLALFSVLSVTIVTTLLDAGLGTFNSPLMVALALTIWGAVLGLAAILVGTLCDERAGLVKELHTAYVGVVEVLSKYLQGGNPRVKTRSARVAELSQMVAESLRLPPKQVDDIRVAALLFELGNVEVTTQVISRAFDTLDENNQPHTFRGTELVHSLGSVLNSALPLLANQDDALRDYLSREDPLRRGEMPIGARIIRAVRAYYDATADQTDQTPESHEQVINTLREDVLAGYDPHVLDALARITAPSETAEPVALR